MVFQFPDNYFANDPNFTTLFRLLDDFNTYSNEVQSEDTTQQGRASGRHRRGPRPRFDIRETRDNYELYGELPGVDRKDVHIELTQENVLLIKGHVERPYDKPTAKAESPDQKKKCDKCVCPEGKSCEDCVKAKCECHEGKKCDLCGMDKCERHKVGDADATVRYLQKERFVGDFSREFAFPGALQEFDIYASLENGLLKVVVPKQKPSTKSRKIEIK
ncbi:HSP20-like chaperone [Podospora fimiseda]|uniref:HSP20-like chaperone n=1 Tax=Podospora fimiseda TaxID=252190 RepID=A0AAN6YNT5_9PEZI|nr:HSP20-like chaperone [Podospora fimiseda]